MLEREAAVSGEVVGMGMRLQDAFDPQAGVPGGLDVRSTANAGSTTTATPAAASPTR